MQPIIEAHRGYSGRYPENTLLAFRKAIEAGATSIELDVHVSSDSELIVIHDATVDRTSNGQGAVAELSTAQIAKLDAGSWKNPAFAGEKIPTLEETLALTLESNVCFNVEVKKFAGGQRDAKQLTALLQRYAPRGSSHIVSSFDLDALLQVRQADATIPLALLGSQGDHLLAEAVKHHFPWIHCSYRGISRDLLYAAHQQAIKVMIWTFDQPAGRQHYTRLGVDKICTNYIAEMIQA
ncbi:MAG: Glycerophosphoryl diester phosphodiesterase [bacterium ADurb.Bin478]|nr:MAG: Glycerophosphoryl diester phosphodiesterase [bacterium ADurb.Bin478]